VASTVGPSSFPPGFIGPAPGEPGCVDDVVVGLQTDAPLKRAVKPRGGWRVVEKALQAAGKEADPTMRAIYGPGGPVLTHNDAVFNLYTPEIRAARKAGLLTGLPDAYSRGRIIGDYRRLPLYGLDRLIAEKRADHDRLGVVAEDGSTPETAGRRFALDDDALLLREEVGRQVAALEELRALGASYGCDLGRPARNAREATQWLYLAYLGSVREQDGAAMSLGRVDAFLDAWISRDLARGALTEATAQEIIDHFVVKLRLVRHLRTPDYDALFSGDPTWVTAAVAGTRASSSDRASPAVHGVTATTWRLLHTLETLGPAPEPNLTVLWATGLPEPFRRYAARLSAKTCALQYESDDVMAPRFGLDYGIACCVSAMRMGKDMQYFGARMNLPKLLLMVLNGGRDELTGAQVGPAGWAQWRDDFRARAEAGEPLDYKTLNARLDVALDWLANIYVSTMNAIHWSHDRHCYESVQMALHDTKVHRLMAFGCAGLSCAVDSLVSIRDARVFPVYDDAEGSPTRGLATSFRVEEDPAKGAWTAFGNADERTDAVAKSLTSRLSESLRRYPALRGAEHTLSVLTITSNIVYGKKTGDTPDGRLRGEPFAPGANPMSGRDTRGAASALTSVSSVDWGKDCMDGVSVTLSLTPAGLGKHDTAREQNLCALLDGYLLGQGGQHLNINVLDRATLEDAMEHPERHPGLTLRVSGYAVHFVKLTREQQLEVIRRTFHEG